MRPTWAQLDLEVRVRKNMNKISWPSMLCFCNFSLIFYCWHHPAKENEKNVIAARLLSRLYLLVVIRVNQFEEFWKSNTIYTLVFVLYFRTLFWDGITIIWDENIVYVFNWEKRPVLDQYEVCLLNFHQQVKKKSKIELNKRLL